MYALQQFFEAIRDFVELGGDVLLVIALVIGVLIYRLHVPILWPTIVGTVQATLSSRGTFA